MKHVGLLLNIGVSSNFVVYNSVLAVNVTQSPGLHFTEDYLFL